MAQKDLKTVAKRIKALKIQGASKVRDAVIACVKFTAQKSNAKNLSAFRKEIKKAMYLLASARPTEPDTRTALRILLKALNAPALTVAEAKNNLLKACTEYKKNREQALKKIAEFGAQKIPKNSIIFTHCHSHTVEEILKKARKKIDCIICTETRPRFQGRITAANLSKAGLNIELIVDSAAARFLRKANAFFTGCDAILEDGSIVNKIGTKTISLAAIKEDTPHYVCSSSHSFDPITFFGVQEPIEERNPKEIWNKKLKRVKILNPAFDVTPGDCVKEIICEKGCFAPETFTMLMFEELKNKSRKELSLIELLKRKH